MRLAENSIATMLNEFIDISDELIKIKCERDYRSGTRGLGIRLNTLAKQLWPEMRFTKNNSPYRFKDFPRHLDLPSIMRDQFPNRPERIIRRLELWKSKAQALLSAGQAESKVKESEVTSSVEEIPFEELSRQLEHPPTTVEIEQYAERKPNARHSEDFRYVSWFSANYSFTATQAACVKILWEAWENKTPEVGGDAILVKVGSNSPRLSDIFKKHPAWNSMIVPGKTKGSYRLIKPSKKK